MSLKKSDIVWKRPVYSSLSNPQTYVGVSGRTSDITVHERQPYWTLKEVYIVSSEALGGTKINAKFNRCLIAIIGAPVFKKVCDANKADQLDLQRELEEKLRTITTSMKGKITVKVPSAIQLTYESEMGESIEDAIECSPCAGKM